MNKRPSPPGALAPEFMVQLEAVAAGRLWLAAIQRCIRGW